MREGGKLVEQVKRVIYYTDELNEDFSGSKVKPKTINAKYKYISKNPFYQSNYTICNGPDNHKCNESNYPVNSRTKGSTGRCIPSNFECYRIDYCNNEIFPKSIYGQP